MRVEGEIADIPINAAFIPAGDARNDVIVSSSVMKEGDICLGDLVEMRFRVADQDHIDIPQTLAEAVKASKHIMAVCKLVRRNA